MRFSLSGLMTYSGASQGPAPLSAGGQNRGQQRGPQSAQGVLLSLEAGPQLRPPSPVSVRHVPIPYRVSPRVCQKGIPRPASRSPGTWLKGGFLLSQVLWQGTRRSGRVQSPGDSDAGPSSRPPEGSLPFARPPHGAPLSTCTVQHTAVTSRCP